MGGKFLLLLALLGIFTPKPVVVPTAPEETYYEVGGHYYDRNQIAWAVEEREQGKNVRLDLPAGACGIKGSGRYAKFPTRAEGIRRCASLLSKYLSSRSVTETLQIWKTGHLDNSQETKKYIKDITAILSNNAGYSSLNT